ncbi:MAG: hypothetical protein MZV70_54390 [Desulfobacterales bacterium]|nr:hypothetical protein [Desulfobacterales bacterium]
MPSPQLLQGIRPGPVRLVRYSVLRLIVLGRPQDGYSAQHAGQGYESISERGFEFQTPENIKKIWDSKAFQRDAEKTRSSATARPATIRTLSNSASQGRGWSSSVRTVTRLQTYSFQLDTPTLLSRLTRS